MGSDILCKEFCFCFLDSLLSSSSFLIVRLSSPVVVGDSIYYLVALHNCNLQVVHVLPLGAAVLHSSSKNHMTRCWALDTDTAAANWDNEAQQIEVGEGHRLRLLTQCLVVEECSMKLKLEEETSLSALNEVSSHNDLTRGALENVKLGKANIDYGFARFPNCYMTSTVAESTTPVLLSELVPLG